MAAAATSSNTRSPAAARLGSTSDSHGKRTTSSTPAGAAAVDLQAQVAPVPPPPPGAAAACGTSSCTGFGLAPATTARVGDCASATRGLRHLDCACATTTARLRLRCSHEAALLRMQLLRHWELRLLGVGCTTTAAAPLASSTAAATADTVPLQLRFFVVCN